MTELLTTPLSHRFHRALERSYQVHLRQARKGSQVPYISHLLAVTAIVLEHGGGEEAAIAALLHDAVEDQGGEAMLEAIRTEFGDSVAGIVAECSDTRETPKPPWRPRKEKYLEHLRGASRDAALVAAADRLHNLRSQARDLEEGHENAWTKFNAPKEDQLWLYGAFLERLRERGDLPASLLGEIQAVVAQIARRAAAG